ncbi:MAG: hypothetical protein F2663_07940 [Actinobacteria bacterium]|uniref:histidine kinase n=1 Tax=freshwater metagenome TaxID=449393 RepID=A0A6J6PZV2_9ZZZZ|nr:hypothetical protein [Actinomycetota bacterium]
MQCAQHRQHVDALRIDQALSNLLENAFTHGSGDVVMSVTPDDEDVVFSVRDHGAGFPDGFGERAFDRFTRADEARSSTGTGLGLAIVAAIARAHGGEATIVPGAGGAEITLRIPRS